VGAKILILLAAHAFGALTVFVSTLRKGGGFQSAIRWGGLGLVLGLLSFGVWSWVFRKDWGFGYKLQAMLISAVMEGGVLFFVFFTG